MYADGFCWMIRCKSMIYQGGELRLIPLGFQGEIMQTIDQTKAIQLKQYDQSNTISDTVRAIKAMRTTIWPEQNDQSDMISNMIRTKPGVVIVTSLVAPTRRPET